MRFAVIGSPVGHSKSPTMHEAAFRALRLGHSYEKIETTEAELPARVDALRRGELAGINVTVPHKAKVLSWVDEVDESARVTGAANTLVRLEDGRVRAHNTDMPAVARELTRIAGDEMRFAGAAALVLGSGGAARAAVVALATKLGVRRVMVRARALADRAGALAFIRSIEGAIAAGDGRGAAATLTAEGLVAPEREDADLMAIVQATSCGMSGGPPGELVADAVAWDSVPEQAAALDVVYVPRITPFLERARARGLASDDGLGMLARQGALAFELWLGVPAPFDVMLAALGPSRERC